jgi:hypothetical protein
VQQPERDDNVTISGWPNQGYDQQHADAMAPNKDADR